MADTIDTTRKHSSEIIAAATLAKAKGGIANAEKIADAEKQKSGGCCSKDSKAELARKRDELKGELEMDEHQIDIEELLQRLGHTAETVPVTKQQDDEGRETFEVDTAKILGLNDKQVEQAREKYGKNVLSPPPKTPECIVVLKHLFGDFFSMLLWGGAVLCFIGYALKLELDNLYLGLVLAFVVFFTGLFGYFQEKKSSDLMDSFKNMMPQETIVIRCDDSGNAGAKNINAIELVPGDVIKIKYGDKIPADVRVIECSDDFNVDNSSLTGESEPQRRSIKNTDENPLETQNLCFFGTQCPEGQAHGLVVKTGDYTVMGRIAALTSTLEDDSVSPIKKEVNHFVAIISGVAIVLGIGFFIIGLILGTDIISNLVFMIGIIVANVPEGLILTVLVCLSLTAQRMFSSNVLVKDLEGVETLGSTTCICSDKTGTLTQNIMTVQKVCYDNTRYSAMTTSFGDATLDVESKTFDQFLRCAIVCNTAEFDEDSKFGYIKQDGQKIRDTSKKIPFEKMVEVGGQTEMRVQWKTNGDATESALIKFAQKYHDVTTYRQQYKEKAKVPFNSKNKFMIVISEYPENLHNAQTDANQDANFLLTMKGAPERVIQRCDRVLINGVVEPMTPARKAEIEALQMKCSKEGLRVLGFAELPLDSKQYPSDYTFTTEKGTENFPMGSRAEDHTSIVADFNPRAAEKLVFLGLYALIDPPRPQVRPAVQKCKTAGIRVIMVTGDHPITAKAIARQVGIIWGDPLRGGDQDGPATQDDYEEWNAKHGLTKENRVSEDGKHVWFDPRLAPAIVVPGWEILADDLHLNMSEPYLNPQTELNEVPPEKWDDILGHTQIVFARTSPQQKLIIVENCKKRGEIVAVTGDGVNDAPALRKAHIGVAMGIMGSDVSKEAADMILLDDNFASIVQGVQEGRLIFDNLKKSIAYTLSSNIPEIAPFLCFITIAIPLPLSTVLILFVDLGTDMIPAISMAWENAEADIMRRPPRNADKDHLVTKKLIFFAYLQIGVIQALAGFFTYIVVLSDYGYPASILPGAGALDNWGKQTLWCQTEKGYFVNQNFDPHNFDRSNEDGTWQEKWSASHPIWWEGPAGDQGSVTRCTYAAKDIKGNSRSWDAASTSNTECIILYEKAVGGSSEATAAVGGSTAKQFAWQPERPHVQDCWDPAKPESNYNSNGILYTHGMWVSSYQAQNFLKLQNYNPYIPFKGRTSIFWSNQWLMSDLYGSEHGSNQQSIAGFGLPKIKLAYARYLFWNNENKEPDTEQYKKWNVDVAEPFGPALIEPIVYFTYQSNGRYDISNYAVNINNVYFPNTTLVNNVTKAVETAYNEGFEFKRVEDTDTFGSPTAPMEIPSRNTQVDGLSSNTLAIMQNECSKGVELDGYKCSDFGNLGFGTADLSYPSVQNYDAIKNPFPTYGEVIDFSANCNGNKPANEGAPSSTCDQNESGLKVNVMSRMLQKEALHHAQTAYFVAIVIVQWSDLLICKTRMNSIYRQGMLNGFMNFGIIFETLLACLLCYIPVVNIGIQTRPIRLTHWLPAVPFTLWIFAYDEVRKMIMRTTTKVKKNKLTGQIERDAGWMERNTYY